MNSIFKLLRLQIDNKYDFFKKKRKKTFKSFGGYAIIFLLIFILVYFLGGRIVSYLNILMNKEFFTITFFVAQAISLIFGMASVLKNLYMSKENELLIVFPVSFNELYLSKILILYISELIFNLVYITPILLAIGTLGIPAGAIGIWYFIIVILFTPILPILPLAIAVIISIPIMYIIKFFRKQQLLSTIFIIGIVIVFFVLYMRIVPSITGAFNIAEKQMETSFKVNLAIKRIGSSIPIYYWMAPGFIEAKHSYTQAIFLIISLALFVLSTFIIKPFFKSIILMGNEAVQIKGKKKSFKERSQFSELLLTQFRLLFRSPNYVFEYLMFPFLMPIITIAYDQLLFSIVVNQMGKALIVASHVLVVGIIAFIASSISSTAISRDGAMTYFIKSSPASFYKQTIVKILFNLIITFAAILLTVILCLIINIADSSVIILTGISVFIVSIGHICQSYDWDLRNPTLKWYDSNEIQALNKNTTKSIVLGIVLALLMFAVMAIFYYSLITGFIIIMIAGIIYSLSRIYLLYYRINYFYNKMEI